MIRFLRVDNYVSAHLTKSQAWMLRLLMVVAVMLLLPNDALAYSDFAFNGNFKAVQSTSDWSAIYFTTKAGDNHYKGTLDATSMVNGGTYYFKFYNEENSGSNQNWWSNGETWDFTNNSTITKTVNGNTDANMSFVHNSKYKSYDVDAIYTEGQGWQVTVKGNETSSSVGSLKIESDVINGWEGEAMQLNSDGSYTYVFDASQTTIGSYVWFRFRTNADDNSSLLANTNPTDVTVNGDAVQATLGKQDNNHNFRFTVGAYTQYTVTVTSDNKVSVTGGGTERPIYLLKYSSTTTSSNGESTTTSAILSQMVENNGIYEFSIPNSAYTSTGVSFTVYKANGYNSAYTDDDLSTDNQYGTGSDLTLANNGQQTGLAQGSATTFTINATGDDAPSDNIYVDFNPTSLSITATWKTVAEDNTEKDNDNIYIELSSGDGNWHEVKMSWSRNRDLDFNNGNQYEAVGKEAESNNIFQNINFKSDDLARLIGAQQDETTGFLKNGQKVLWYFLKKAGTSSSVAYYFPASGDLDMATASTNVIQAYDGQESNTANQVHGNFSTYFVSNIDAATTTPSHYFYFEKKSDDNAVSYTFTVNRAYTANKGNGVASRVGFVYNKPMLSGVNDENINKGYFLVGNFSDAKGKVSIEPTDNSHPMKRYYYKDGIAYLSGETSADGSITNVTNTQWTKYLEGHAGATPDSIVYRAHVDRPANGWGALYIAVMRSDHRDWTSGWAFRPQVNAAETQTPFDGAMGHSIDGIALNGGLTTGSRNQSLNPKMQDALKMLGLSNINEIPSYDFSFNATTTTYRLVFNKPYAEQSLPLMDLGDLSFYVNGRGSYRFFRTWYAEDSYAFTNDSPVDAYIVSNITKDSQNKKVVVTLSKLTLPKVASDNANEAQEVRGHAYLYADTPMLLAYKATDDATSFTSGDTWQKSEQKGHYSQLNIPVRKLQNSQFLPDNIVPAPYFVGTSDPKWLDQHYDDHGSKGYNYCFGFYRRTSEWYTGTELTTSDNKKISDLGLWVVRPAGGNSATHYAYMHLPEDYVEGCDWKDFLGTTYDFSSQSGAKKIPAMFIKWENSNETTGISDVKTETRVNDETWYTLQGVRVSKPSVKGVYIHNGKKVMVK